MAKEMNVENCSNAACGKPLGEILYTVKIRPELAFCTRTCRATVTGESISEPEQSIRTLESAPKPARKGKGKTLPPAKEPAKTPTTPKAPRAAKGKLPWDESATLHAIKGSKIPKFNGMRGQVAAQFKEGITVKAFLAKCEAENLAGLANLKTIVQGYKIWEARAPK